jgi:hypothetical protein
VVAKRTGSISLLEFKGLSKKEIKSDTNLFPGQQKLKKIKCSG